MSLLNYTYHASPTSHKDVLSKLRTFAVAQGWSSDEYLTNKGWSNGWIAGTADFLQLSTNGYGTQDAIVRFYFEGAGVDALCEPCRFRGTLPGKGTYNPTSATNAVDQDTYYSYGLFNMPQLPSGNHVGVWFFGNDKFIMCIDRVSTTTCVSWMFGIPELFDTTDVFYGIQTSAINGVSNPKYYNINTQPTYWNAPWNEIFAASSTIPYYYDGAGLTIGKVKLSSSISYSDTQGASAGFTTLFPMLQKNVYSGKRVLIKPTIFGKLQSDLWKPVGTLPLYHLNYDGLTFGEQIVYGAETYICFPNCIQSRKYGVAFRIV